MCKTMRARKQKFEQQSEIYSANSRSEVCYRKKIETTEGLTLGSDVRI